MRSHSSRGVVDGRLAEDGPGVVDEDVDARVIGEHLMTEGQRRLAVGEVHGVGVELTAGGFDAHLGLAAGSQRR